MAENDNRQAGVMWQVLMAPHRQNGRSLQEQLRQMLVAAILDGLLPPRGFLPSTRELAQSLGISRNTVIIVYQRLCDEGYLVAQSREGYHVAADAPGLQPGPGTGQSRVATGRAAPDWRRRLLRPPSRQRNIEKRRD